MAYVILYVTKPLNNFSYGSLGKIELIKNWNYLSEVMSKVQNVQPGVC